MAICFFNYRNRFISIVNSSFVDENLFQTACNFYNIVQLPLTIFFSYWALNSTANKETACFHPGAGGSSLCVFLNLVDVLLHPVGAVPLHLVSNVTVFVQGKRCGGMSEISLDGLDVVRSGWQRRRMIISGHGNVRSEYRLTQQPS